MPSVGTDLIDKVPETIESVQSIPQLVALVVIVTGALVGYIYWTEIVRRKKHDVSVQEMNDKHIQLLEKFQKETKLSFEEEKKKLAKDITDDMLNKSNLRMLLHENIDKRRHDLKKDAKEEMSDYCTGSFKTLEYDIKSAHRADVEKAAKEMPICVIAEEHEISCPKHEYIVDANIQAYEAELSLALLEGEKLGWAKIMKNGFITLSNSELDKYIKKTNKQIHSVVWEIMEKQFPKGLLTAPDKKRATLEFTEDVWRDIILRVIEIKTELALDLEELDNEFNEKLRRIYEVGENPIEIEG